VRNETTQENPPARTEQAPWSVKEKRAIEGFAAEAVQAGRTERTGRVGTGVEFTGHTSREQYKAGAARGGRF
jgi:hypothetical protein